MAEIAQSSHPTRVGVRRAKRLSTKVDLTPMVDLGFLLITFFVITTKLSEPKALKLLVPADGPPSKINDSHVLSAIPIRNNQVFYFHGNLRDAIRTGAIGITDFSLDDGIGAVIRAKQASMNKLTEGDSRHLTFIIKPSALSTYGNVVDIIDEMAINNVQRFVLTELTDEEAKLLTSTGTFR